MPASTPVAAEVTADDGPVARYVAAGLRWATTALAVAAGAVLVLGTLVTAAGPHAGDPGTPRLGLDIRLAAIAHADAVWLLVGLTVALVAVTWRHGPPSLRRAVRLLLVLELVQGAIGYTQYALGIPAALVAAHILGAAVLWATAVASGSAHGRQATPRRTRRRHAGDARRRDRAAGRAAFDLDLPRALSHDGPLSLVVVADSTAFTDHLGPQLPTTPHLYPQVAARRARRRARPRGGRDRRRPARDDRARRGPRRSPRTSTSSTTCSPPPTRWWSGVGSFDHAPAGVPPSVEAVAAYLRPTAVRRQVRRGLKAAYPWLVSATGGRRTRTPLGEFDRLFAELLDHVRGLTWGRVAGAAVGPTCTARATTAAGTRRTRNARRTTSRVAERHGFRGVAVVAAGRTARRRAQRRRHPLARRRARGRRRARSPLRSCPPSTGAAPTVGLPAAAAAALGRDR